MAQKNDILKHLQILKSVYDTCENKDLMALYDYFMTLDEQYVQNTSAADDNSYAALVHKLHPAKYAQDSASGITFSSVRSRLICCYCHSKLSRQDEFDLHIRRFDTLTCSSCNQPYTYENHLVIYFRKNYQTKIYNIIHGHFRIYFPTKPFPTEWIKVLLEFYCDIMTWKKVGKFLRERIYEMYTHMFPHASRLGQHNMMKNLHLCNNLIWKDIISLVREYRRQPFSGLSVDLVKGMFRQLDFTNKLCAHYSYWINNDVLISSIRRYEMFLHMVPLSKGKFLVPTLDIDLVWHTHLQSPTQYTEYTVNICGTRLNHDDDIEGGNSSAGYTRAYMKWSQMYYEAISPVRPSFYRYRQGNILQWINPIFYYKWFKYSHHKVVSHIPQSVYIGRDDHESYSIVGTPVNDIRARPYNHISRILDSVFHAPRDPSILYVYDGGIGHSAYVGCGAGDSGGCGGGGG